jgi:hypothetical protein
MHKRTNFLVGLPKITCFGLSVWLVLQSSGLAWQQPAPGGVAPLMGVPSPSVPSPAYDPAAGWMTYPAPMAGYQAAYGRAPGLLGFGLVQPSDRAFDDFISPMTNPVFFEDPRTLTEVRFIALHHRLPDALGGNSVQAYAPQIRLALTERLSLLVTKGSVIYTQSPLLESGFLDLAGGFKYNLLRDPAAGRLLSGGVTFETPTGSQKSLQGNGDGELNVFLSGAMRVGRRSHWLSTMGWRRPMDDLAENEIMYWSGHFDHRLPNRPIYLFTEFNWFHYLSSGGAFGLPIEGGDIFNLGSVGVTGNDLVTQAVGLKVKPRDNVEAGVAFEFPLTERQGILENRWTFDLAIRY